MNFDSSKLYAAVMAGGRGERFWPAGRRKRPKQFLPLLGDRTMLEETVQRLFPLIAPERLLVIVGDEYAERVRELLPIPAENVVGEPEGRDTAPCVALAAALIRRRDPDATMALLPADHVIRPAKLFQETLRSAAAAAQRGALVTLGVMPSFASTGYGYLHLGRSEQEGFREVLEFREKPDAATAERFFRDGNYRWNSGIFVWRCDAIGAAFREFAPALGAKFDAWSRGADYRRDFAECEKISIDYAVMEKARNVIAGDAGFYWNDLGCWSSLRTVLPPDANGNAVRGRAVAIDCSGSVIMNDDAEGLLGVIGMHGVAVVKSAGGVLVVPLSEEQKVRELVERLRNEAPEFL